MLEGMPSGGGCPHHSGHLARVHHSHVHCSVLPSNPVGKQHISRAAVFPRDEESHFPDRSKRKSGEKEYWSEREKERKSGAKEYWRELIV